jgi:phospholipid transport system substrate-binding protein
MPGPFGAGPVRQVPPQAGPQAAPATGPAAAAPQARAEHPTVQAATTIKEGLDKLIAFVSQKEVPNKLQTAAFLDKEIAPYFDFPYMAGWVAGPAAAKLSAADKEALAARLEASVLSSLGGHLASYSGQRTQVLRPRWSGRGAVTVPVAILRAGAYPARLEFRMYKSESGWKVYDVIANGRSAASYYRLRFQRQGTQGLSEEPQTGAAPAAGPTAGAPARWAPQPPTGPGMR